jgi:hypothetical protein
MVELLFIILVNTEVPRVMEGSLFNEFDYEYAIEARRRSKGNKKRRRGGNGLR